MTQYNFNRLIEIAQEYDAELFFDESIAPYTSFKIGGAAKLLFKINDEDCLIRSVICCKVQGIPYFIMGKGSNVLVSGEGYNGVVFLLGGLFSGVRVSGETLHCLSGTPLSYICRCARENLLTGLEFAYGIPGTAGGAVYMNAGAYGGEMKDVVKSCHYLDEFGNVCGVLGDELDLSYRHSIFCENKGVILSVDIELKHGEKFKIDSRMNELMEKRREKQPLEYPSAGSTFKRPEGDYAARLIDSCGLKGFTHGGAAVSEKHSGFVINKGGATFNDVIYVINAVKERVFKETGVMLECEIEILS